MSQFQLFPPPTPQGVPKNPFRKAPRRPSTSTESTVSTPLEDLKGKAAEAKAVVIQVVEPHSVKPPPKAHIAPPPPPPPPLSSTPELRPRTRSAESLPQSSIQQSKEHTSSPGETLSLSPLSGREDVKTSRTPSPAQVSPSPVIPMRSMFPQYNPDAPLSQQQYHSGIPNNFSRPRARPTELDLSPAPEIDQALGPKTVPASVLNFPTGVLEPVETVYSSTADLKGLWEAANGQRPESPSETFNLRMKRLDPATFVFGEAHSPFYTMQTYSTDELSLSRANPSAPTSKIPVMMLQLEDRRRREPPHDGLVSHLFSRLAAMLAIEQAGDLARQHRLPPTEAAEVETNALKRAAAQESCKLSWNHAKHLYELHHPSLNKQPQTPALVGAAGIPLSPVRSKHSSVLHITVSSPSPDSLPGRRQPPAILVTAPPPASISLDAAAHTAATPRTSTLPLTDTDEPLASLDLATMTLSIAATTITNTIPSLYAIDSVIAALLAVATSDTTTNPILADMPLYPTNHQATNNNNNNNNNNNPSSSHYSPGQGTFKGNLITTLAEREDAQAGTTLISYLTSSTSTSSQKPHRKWSLPRLWKRPKDHQKNNPNTNATVIPKKKKTKKTKKTKSHTISIPMSIPGEEIDLEKYGRFTSRPSKQTGDSGQAQGSGSGSDEEIPGLVRGSIKLLFLGLKVMVYVLTVAFKVLAWVLVTVAGCLSSGKG